MKEPVVVCVRSNVGTLERVCSQIEDLRHSQSDEWLRPDAQRSFATLLHENYLPIVETQRYQVAIVIEVDEALSWAVFVFSSQIRNKVVAINVHTEMLACRVVPLLQLLDNVRFARHGKNGRQPVVVLDDFVGDG